MALAVRNFAPAMSLAEALRLPALGQRQPRQESAEYNPRDRVLGLDERVDGQPLDRSSRRAANAQAATADAAQNAADAPPRATARAASLASNIEDANRPIAYTATGAAVHEALPRGVFLDIVV